MEDSTDKIKVYTMRDGPSNVAAGFCLQGPVADPL